MGQNISESYLLPDEQANDFNPANYLRPGLTIYEILAIRHSFERLKPVNDRIEVKEFLEKYKNAYMEGKIEDRIGDRTELNFDEFFEILANFILQNKEQLKNVEFDSNPVQVSCLLCPAISQVN
jgi:hypothetical protein